MRLKAIPGLFSLALSGFLLHASQEGTLNWSEFTVQSKGIGSSGPVKVYGTQDSAGIQSLHIAAFGKTYSASKTQLASLKGFFFNGLQLTYEHGYKETGGQALYLTFTSGFVSGVRQSKTITLHELSGFKP